MRDLCPRHTQSVSLCDALDRVLDTGVVALGEVKISVADIDLLYLGLQLVITSIETARGPAPGGDDWPNPGRVVRGGPQPLLAEDTSESCPQTEPTSSSVPALPGETERLAAPGLAGHGRQLAAPSPGDSSQEGLPLARCPSRNDLIQCPPPLPGRPPQQNGLAKLVLTVIRLLHELVKRQGVRRVEAGSLSIAEIERLGTTLMRQAQEIERLSKEFGLEQKDLNLDLGPLGKLF